MAVESALQDRFGTHAGWAHNTLFISELASQRHVLPAHLHPGFRGKAPKKARAPDEDTSADLEGPVTPPPQLGRGPRSAARSAGAKRRADKPANVKQEQDLTGIPIQPGAGYVLQPAEEQSARRHGGADAGLKVEQLQDSAAVNEAVEGVAMEAFAAVRQVDAGAQAAVADTARHAEKQLTAAGAGSTRKRGRKAASKVTQPHPADART